MYQILYDYGGYEGSKLNPTKYATVAKAVAAAVACSCGTPFLIVQVIDWEAVEKFEEET
jgi:hypothetical protein